MKPRLKVAELTQEDWLAWLHARHGWCNMNNGDRRDADLMYQAKQDGALLVTIHRTLDGLHSRSVWWEFHAGPIPQELRKQWRLE